MKKQQTRKKSTPAQLAADKKRRGHGTPAYNYIVYAIWARLTGKERKAALGTLAGIDRVWYGISRYNLKTTRINRECAAKSGAGGSKSNLIRKFGAKNLRWEVAAKCQTKREAALLCAKLKSSAANRNISLNSMRKYCRDNYNKIEGNPYGVCYKITLGNGQFYIGRTTKSIDERVRKHLETARLNGECKKQTKFYEALRAEGCNTPSYLVLSRHKSEETLFRAEAKLVARALRVSPDLCLNMKLGDTPAPPPPEQREAESETVATVPMSDRFRFNPSGLGSLAYGCKRRAIGQSKAYELERAGYKLNGESWGVATTCGTILHEAAAIPAKKRKGWLTKTGGGFDTLYERLHKEVMDKCGAFEWDNITPDVETMREQVERMAAAIDTATNGLLWKYPDIWEVEQHHIADVQDDLAPKYQDKQVRLSGRFDFYNVLSNTVYDIKTGKTKKPGNYGLQLAAYAVLQKKRGYSPSMEAVVVYVQRHRLTSKTLEQNPCQLIKYDLRPYMRELKRVIEDGVENTMLFWSKGTPNPNLLSANPKDFLCSPKFCRLHGTAACDVSHESVIQPYQIGGGKKVSQTIDKAKKV